MSYFAAKLDGRGPLTVRNLPPTSSTSVWFRSHIGSLWSGCCHRCVIAKGSSPFVSSAISWSGKVNQAEHNATKHVPRVLCTKKRLITVFRLSLDALVDVSAELFRDLDDRFDNHLEREEKHFRELLSSMDNVRVSGNRSPFPSLDLQRTDRTRLP